MQNAQSQINYKIHVVASNTHIKQYPDYCACSTNYLKEGRHRLLFHVTHTYTQTHVVKHMA